MVRLTADDGKEKVDISNKVFVGNLSFDVTRDELIAAFASVGKVVDAKLPTDRETGRPRGFAFVEFEDDDAAQKCIATMNGKDLKGRPLRVNEAENRPPATARRTGRTRRPPPRIRSARRRRRRIPRRSAARLRGAAARLQRRGRLRQPAALEARHGQPSRPAPPQARLRLITG